MGKLTTIYFITRTNLVIDIVDRFVTKLEDVKVLAARDYWPDAKDGDLIVTFDKEYMTVTVEDPIENDFLIYRVWKIERLVPQRSIFQKICSLFGG